MVDMTLQGNYMALKMEKNENNTKKRKCQLLVEK